MDTHESSGTRISIGIATCRREINRTLLAKGDLIATDGPHEIRALCDDCTILMPTREPIVGREAVYLTRPI